MNDTDLHNQLSRLATSNIELPANQRRLKAQLLAQHSPQQQSRGFSLGTFTNDLREGITMKKLLSLSGVVAVITVVAVLAVTTLSTPSPASAAQQITKAKSEVQRLNPAEVAALEAKFQQKLDERLNEAQAASDLRSLSSAEVKALTGHDLSAKNPESQGIKLAYVAYTSPAGEQVVIVLDAQNNNRPMLLFVNSGQGWNMPDVTPATDSAVPASSVPLN